MTAPRALVLLNGPPRCGKDSAGAALAASVVRALPVKFAAPLRVYVEQVLGVSIDDARKDEEIPGLGVSVRRAMIALSEEHLKPMLGQDIFGRLLRRRLELPEYAGRVVVSTDSGFATEAGPVLDLVSRERTLLVRLSRPGCDFTNDSRSYVDLPGVTTLDLENRGTLAGLGRQVVRHVRPWLAQLPFPEVPPCRP